MGYLSYSRFVAIWPMFNNTKKKKGGDKGGGVLFFFYNFCQIVKKGGARKMPFIMKILFFFSFLITLL